MTNKKTSDIDLVERLAERIMELRVALNTNAGLSDPAKIYKFQVLLDDLEKQSDTITRLQADVERAWNAGFTYGTGLYSSSPLPSAREDGWNRFRSSVGGE